MKNKLLLTIVAAMGVFIFHASAISSQEHIAPEFDQRYVGAECELDGTLPERCDIGQISNTVGLGVTPGDRSSFVAIPRETLLGDANLDGEVNFLDILAFIEILTNGGPYLPEADIDS